MIENTPKLTGDQRIDDLRNAIEHRATWFGLLIDEAMKAGLDESFARKAIFNCGCFHGQTKFPRTSDLQEFADAFANDNVVKIFEMTPECTEDTLNIDFHYCPLVSAWKKLGYDDKKMDLYCDIAMDGDRGIINEYPDFEFKLGKTIAKGDKVCEIRISKK